MILNSSCKVLELISHVANSLHYVNKGKKPRNKISYNKPLHRILHLYLLNSGPHADWISPNPGLPPAEQLSVAGVQHDVPRIAPVDGGEIVVVRGVRVLAPVVPGDVGVPQFGRSDERGSGLVARVVVVGDDVSRYHLGGDGSGINTYFKSQCIIIN